MAVSFLPVLPLPWAKALVNLRLGINFAINFHLVFTVLSPKGKPFAVRHAQTIGSTDNHTRMHGRWV